MRIWVAVTLFVLVVLIVSNDVSARKSAREKPGKNKRSIAVEETSDRENDQSADYGKKSKSVKSQDKYRGGKQRRSVGGVDPEVPRNKENTRKEAEPSEQKHGKKSRPTDPKNKNSEKTEVPLKNKKATKEEKKLETNVRSAKKIDKSASVKKRSADESVRSDETSDYAKVSTSKYSKRGKNVEKRETRYSEESGTETNEPQEKRLREHKVKSKKERSRDKTVSSEAEPRKNKTIKKKMEKYHQGGMGRDPERENVLEKARKKSSSPEPDEFEDEKSGAFVESSEDEDKVVADGEEEGADEEIRANEDEEAEVNEDEETEVNEDEEVEANDDEAEEILGNEAPLGYCHTNVVDGTSECDTDRS